MLAACGGGNVSEDEPRAAPWEGRSAEEVFFQLEEDLLAGGERVVEFDVRAEGAFSADLDGRLQLGRGDVLELEASGLFGADPVTLRLSGRPDGVTWANQTQQFQDALPTGLREAVVIGLTRMGVLHNLARLVSGQPPDRADGTARSWVQVEDVQWAEKEDATHRGISFDIRVDGRRAGHATAWIDQDGELVGRDQVVEFPGVEMRVVERYRWLE